MPFPSKLLLDEVIKRLRAYDKGFNLYDHKNIKDRWVISYTKEKIEKAYPLKAPAGKKTHIDIQRLKAIARHFSISSKIFALTVKEIKNKN